MKEITRRESLAVLATTGFVPAALAGPVPLGAAPAPAERELFSIGPFRLGDWYQNARSIHQFDVALLKDAGLTATDLVAVLNQIRVFIVDQRVRDVNGVRFASTEDGYPAIAAAGEFVRTWQGPRGGESSVRVTGLTVGGMLTDNTPTPPTRKLESISFTLEFAVNGKVRERTNLTSGRAFSYELAGKELRRK